MACDIRSNTCQSHINGLQTSQNHRQARAWQQSVAEQEASPASNRGTETQNLLVCHVVVTVLPCAQDASRGNIFPRSWRLPPAMLQAVSTTRCYHPPNHCGRSLSSCPRSTARVLQGMLFCLPCYCCWWCLVPVRLRLSSSHICAILRPSLSRSPSVCQRLAWPSTTLDQSLGADAAKVSPLALRCCCGYDDGACLKRFSRARERKSGGGHGACPGREARGQTSSTRHAARLLGGERKTPIGLHGLERRFPRQRGGQQDESPNPREYKHRPASPSSLLSPFE